MTIEEVTNNPDILNEEVQSEDLHDFYCPKWDRNFTLYIRKAMKYSHLMQSSQ